jgi:hypothetical protein
MGSGCAWSSSPSCSRASSGSRREPVVFLALFGASTAMLTVGEAVCHMPVLRTREGAEDAADEEYAGVASCIGPRQQRGRRRYILAVPACVCARSGWAARLLLGLAASQPGRVSPLALLLSSERQRCAGDSRLTARGRGLGGA